MTSKLIRQVVVILGLTNACALMTSCISNVPPRTIDSAQQEFNDQGFVTGQTTASEIQTALGSPAEIRKEANGDKTYIYIKNRYSTGIMDVDVGTAYIGEYTVDSQGIFKEKNLLARPMSNPLIH